MEMISVSLDDVGDAARRLQGLSEQEKLVLRLRFALDGSYCHTLDDVASGLRLSQAVVRQTELQAFGEAQGVTLPMDVL